MAEKAMHAESDPSPWTRVFGKAGNILARKIAGETILVPIEGSIANMQRIFSLNPVAEAIWPLVDGKNKLHNIVDEVLKVFQVGREQAEADVIEFIDELVRANLIVRVE